MAEPKKPRSKSIEVVPETADRHRQPRKAFHAPADLFAALEAFVSSGKPKPNESECLRTALEEFLEKRGYWPPKSK